MAPPPVFPEGTGPPDGGFGWVVAAAYALNNVVAIPILQNFGLVFRDVFVDLKLSGTDTAVIMNINNAFGLALGLFNGPLLRTFSYRKVAIFGSMLVFSGMVLTAFASSFVEFLVFYGFIMSSGYNLTMASFAYAINSYFSKRRGVAMGFAMTVTGLGPVFMPLVISMLMKEYGPRYTALILSGLALHSLVGALLLQPVRWHLVKLVPDKKAGEDDGDASPTKLPLLVKEGEGKKDSVLENGGVEGGKAAREDDAKLEGDLDEDCNAPMLVARRGSSVSRKSGATLSGRAGDERGLAPSMWASMASIHDGGIGGSFVGLDDDQQRNDKPAKANGLSKPKTDLSDTPWWRRWMHAVVEFFDLGLLRDPVYVNMMLGLSFAVFAEINFSLLTPFILGDRKFSTEQTASLVSIIAVADIIFRFLSPFVRRICRQSVRIMYMLGLLLLVLTRTVFIFCYSYESLIGVMVGLGVAKGLRTVFWLLVIPDYVPIERLPCANGLQSVTNGIVFMALGAPMGLIRDKLGDYNYVIIAINVMTCITLTMWCVEFIIVALRKKRRGRTTDADVEVEKKPKP